MQKLKEVKKAVKDWRQTDSINIKSRILSIRQKLKSVQRALDNDNSDILLQQQEKNLKVELNNWLINEEDQVRQKSRENWLLLGIEILYSFILQPKLDNIGTISATFSISDGELIHEMEAIKIIALDFYQKLFNQDSYALENG